MPEARAKPELSRFDLINGEKKIMATEIQKQVLQLYVGILGRGVNGNADVDQEGFDYWVSQIEAGALSIADARRNFIEEQPEGQALYSGDTASVINGLYQNLFGRDAEAEGLAYWQEAVDNGTLDFAQVAEALVAGAQGSDVDTINARVDAQATVVGADETVDTAGLTAALNELADANEAKSDALVAALDNEQVADEAGTGAKTATDKNVDDALATATGAVETDLDALLGTATNFSTAGDNTKAGLIADGRAAAEKDIADQEKVVADAEADAADGVVSALNTVEARLASYEAAIDAAKKADVAENGEELKFEEINSVTVTEGTVGSPATTTLEIDGVVVAKDINGSWTVEETTAASTKLEDLEGFDTYLASLQAETDAANAEVDAKASLKSAIAEVVALENEDDTITADDVSDNVIGANVPNADGSANVSLDLTQSSAVSADNPDVSIEQGVDAPTAPTVNAVADGTTPNVDEVVFGALTAGQSVTVAGLTLTATEAMTNVEVATAFTSGATPTKGALSGSLSGWTAAGSVTNTSAVDFTSDDSASNVPDISVSVAGQDEVATVTFKPVVAGQTVTVDGVTLTAAADLTADQVATAFSDIANVDAAVGTVDKTTFDNGYTAGTANGSELELTATGDATDLVASAGSGTAVTETAPDADDILDQRDILAAEEKDLADLNEAVAEWEALVALNEELGDLDDAVTAAEEAITDPEEDGGLGVSLLEGADNFTANSDVYLFSEDTNQTLTGFGANGEDKIYFGEGYSLVAIPDGDDINDNVGDVAAQEILWAQDGNNLVLYAEEESFAGNSSDGAGADITTITLAGVSAEDVSFEGGYLSAGEVA